MNKNVFLIGFVALLAISLVSASNESINTTVDNTTVINIITPVESVIMFGKIDYKVRCPICLPATQYREKKCFGNIGIYGRMSDGSIECFVPNNIVRKIPVVTVSEPVCTEKTVCTTERKCGVTCDEYKITCEHNVCVDWRSDGQYDCIKYKKIFGHDVCIGWENCTSKLGVYYNKETCHTETVCN